jgi:hypothetical protein
MAFTVAFHDPIKATASTFFSGGIQHGAIALVDANGESIRIYTLPDVAQAVADAFNAAIDLGESE